MKSLALIVVCYLVLVLQTTFSGLVPIEALAPNLLLPVTIYLGVTPSVHLVRGAVMVFALGFFLDSFGGSPMGIHTFILEATFVLSRVAGLRLLMRGYFSQGVLTFVIALLVGGMALALQAIFERPPPFQVVDLEATFLRLAIPALTTAVAAPAVFWLAARLEGARGRSRDEPGAAR